MSFFLPFNREVFQFDIALFQCEISRTFDIEFKLNKFELTILWIKSYRRKIMVLETKYEVDMHISHQNLLHFTSFNHDIITADLWIRIVVHLNRKHARVRKYKDSDEHSG